MSSPIGQPQTLGELVLGVGFEENAPMCKRLYTYFQLALHVDPVSSILHVSIVPPHIGLPTSLSPCCRPGIGSTHTAALMTCFQVVSFMYCSSAALSLVVAPYLEH